MLNDAVLRTKNEFGGEARERNEALEQSSTGVLAFPPITPDPSLLETDLFGVEIFEKPAPLQLIEKARFHDIRGLK
jgi:hypothetical protein